jgi:adenylate kinase
LAGTVPARQVVVFGRPGSGKSSLTERLASDFGFALFSTGELLREAVRKGGPLGKEVGELLRRGELAPDDLVLEVLVEALAAAGPRNRLFDGFPRTTGQIPLLAECERRFGFEIDVYLEIAVSREEAVARMTGRRVCPLCGATYHLRTKPPHTPGVCDLDDTALEQRPDDTKEVIERRQQIFEEQTGPVIEYYRRHAPAKFRSVNGEQPLDDVYRDACVALGLIVPDTHSTA